MPPPQGGGGGGGGGQSGDSLDFFWGIVLVIAAVGLLWYFGKAYIIDIVFHVRAYEIMAIDYVLQGYTGLAAPLHLPTPNLDILEKWLAFIQSRPGIVPFSALAAVSTEVGLYLRYPVAFILGVLALILYFSHLTLKFKNIFTMPKLRSLEVENWPKISPVVKLNLIKEDINKGPWAMAASPMRFAKDNRLLKEEIKEGKPTVTVIPGAARRIFSLQLGPLWSNVTKAPKHVQALYAVFAARANQDREAADKLLDQIARSSVSGKLDFSGTTELLRKYANTKVVAMATHRHAYLLTVMASMLELARTDGVMAASEFLWLKPVDRRLWYMLNVVGRQTAFPEVSGAFAHWKAENKLGRGLQVPMVDEAAKGLEAAIADILYEPDEE